MFLPQALLVCERVDRAAVPYYCIDTRIFTSLRSLSSFR